MLLVKLILSLLPTYGTPVTPENPFEAEPIKAQLEIQVDKTYVFTYWDKSNCFNFEVRD